MTLVNLRNTSRAKARTAMILFISLVTALSGGSVAPAQINMAALAQFKQNQQAALAKQLQGNAASTAGRSGKARKHGKTNADAPMVVPKPPLIKAQNRSFKGNFSDMRKSNMR